MADKTIEDRVSALEANKDDWGTPLKLRFSGCEKLEARGKELAQGSKEFWKLKSELFELLWPDLEPHILKAFGNESEKIRAELYEVLSYPSFFVGVFPTGGPWGSCKSVDVKFRPCLLGLRAHDMIARLVSPKLKEINAGVSVWVPMSPTDMKKREARRNQNRGRSRSRGRERRPARRS